MRLGPQGAAAAARPPGFAFPGSRKLVPILGSPIESPLSNPLHPGYVFSQTWIFF